MSSQIMVYGSTEFELDWMRKNFPEVDKMFREIHPVFETEDESFQHGIEVIEQVHLELIYHYYWRIPCHWDIDEHLKKTEENIKSVLENLNAPKGIFVYPSPLHEFPESDAEIIKSEEEDYDQTQGVELSEEEIAKRQELISKLMWNSGGTGLGICSFAGMAIWCEDRPTSERPDLISIVAVNEPKERYTNEELEKLVAFSERRTTHYDTMFSWRRGANLIIIGKEREGLWLRKRLTWEIGPYWAKTLEEAMELFDKEDR